MFEQLFLDETEWNPAKESDLRFKAQADHKDVDAFLETVKNGNGKEFKFSPFSLVRFIAD